MRFDFRVDTDMRALMEAHIDAAEIGVTRGVREASEGLKRDWRGQVVASGLGRRLANTVRAQSYPKSGQSIGAAGLAYSREPKVIDAHDRGVTIRGKEGLWLAIPIGPAKNMRGPRGEGLRATARITPYGFEKRTGLRLRFVFRRGQPSLLVAEGRITKKGKAARSRSKTGRGVTSIPVFILLPQVKLRKKLDLDRASEDWGNRLPGLILKHWRDVRA